MIDFDDKRWDGLKGGYRTPFDPRPALKRLKTNDSPESAWRELWEGLHHQGDVGEASYAAMPHIVQIHRLQGGPAWNPYAIFATVELARDSKRDPVLPVWLEKDYFNALHELAAAGVAELGLAKDREEIHAILALLAISKNARTYGRLLLS